MSYVKFIIFVYASCIFNRIAKPQVAIYKGFIKVKVIKKLGVPTTRIEPETPKYKAVTLANTRHGDWRYKFLVLQKMR